MDARNAFFTFVESATTPYHCAKAGVELLRAQGFTLLDSAADWEIKAGGKYVTVFQDLYLFAFTVGSDWTRGSGYRMAVSHGDTPGFRVKATPCKKQGNYLFLNAEVYGGPNLASWADRPLSLAGRVALRSDDPMQPNMKLVDLRRPVAIIPDVAVHLVSENSESKQKKSVKMPLLTVGGENLEQDYLLHCLAKELDVKAEDILDYELYVYHCAPCAVVGMEEDLVSAPRLDNLTSVYAVLRALANGERRDGVNVSIVFDGEEIGSRTKGGAFSAVTEVFMKKLYLALGLSEEQYLGEMLRGMLLSCDVAHAYHPMFASAYDDKNACYPNGGVCIKQAASQTYATDSAMGAMIRQLCESKGIPCQRFANHTDVRGGSTLANMVACLLGVKAADVGLALLAMHSSMETMGAKDEQHFVDFLTAFMSAE